jgi:hypothetical protein
VLTKDYPDHHDAELVMKLYELRREAVMRESRTLVNAKYWPRNADEATAVLKSDHPLNAAFRQVVTYWEMAYGMARWGIVHADFMMESASEGMLVYAKAAPFLEQLRAQGNPSYFVNAEWIATHSDAGKRAFERYSARARARATKG